MSERTDKWTALAIIIPSFFKYSFRTLVGLGGFYFLYKSFEVVAGKNTSTSIIIEFLADTKFNLSLAGNIVLTLCLVKEKSSKGKIISRKAPRIASLESRIDPERGSSNLSAAGNTNLKDLETL